MKIQFVATYCIDSFQFQEINNYISGKQVSEIAEELIRKRELLSQEKQDLEMELVQLQAQIEIMGKSPRDPAEFDTIALLKQQASDIESRVEIIDAEVKYRCMRQISAFHSSVIAMPEKSVRTASHRVLRTHARTCDS